MTAGTHVAKNPYGDWQPADEDYRGRIRASFARQGFMRHLSARLVDVQPGRVSIEARLVPELAQQHGYMHAGATTTLADTAGGYAAFTLFPADSSVLSAEFKVHLLRPARGPVVRAVAHVVRPGKTLTVCDLEAFDVSDAGEVGQLVMKGTQTLVRLDGAADGPRS